MVLFSLGRLPALVSYFQRLISQGPRSLTPKIMLSAEDFAQQAKRFAVASAQRSPSWAWVDASTPSVQSPFGTDSNVAMGYLRMSPLLVPAARSQATASVADSVMVDGMANEVVDDAAALDMPAADSPCRLDLHIVHSAIYSVPVLLLHGHHSDGAPWTPDELRAFLMQQQQHSGDESAARRLTPLSGTVISQLEHPVLHTPSCCVDPCETASLMGTLLNGAGVISGHDADAQRLDYLSAWWSILAPHVGAVSRSAWAAEDVANRVVAPQHDGV